MQQPNVEAPASQPNPEFVRWAFSDLGPPNLALAAVGDFSARGRFLHSADLYIAASPTGTLATNRNQTGRPLIHLSGPDILEQGIREDIWEFLAAAPVAPLFSRHDFRDHMADAYDF
jgi:hypothetical protein